MELALLQAIVNAVPGAASVLMLLGSLVVVGSVIVAATPSKEDDAAWEKIKAIPLVGGVISALAEFSPLQKKPK